MYYFAHDCIIEHEPLLGSWIESVCIYFGYFYFTTSPPGGNFLVLREQILAQINSQDIDMFAKMHLNSTTACYGCNFGCGGSG